MRCSHCGGNVREEQYSDLDGQYLVLTCLQCGRSPARFRRESQTGRPVWTNVDDLPDEPKIGHASQLSRGGHATFSAEVTATVARQRAARSRRRTP